MKKLFGLFFILVVFFIIFQITLVFLKSSFVREYTYNKDEEKFKIKEVFSNDIYKLDISNKDTKYYLELNNLFNKKDKIIKDIHYKKGDNLNCIYLVYIDNVKSNIVCNKNNIMYTYDYLKSNNTVIKFKQELESKGLNLSSLDNNKTVTIDDKFGIKLYEDNLYDEESIIIWGYSYARLINKKQDFTIGGTSIDKYENTQSRLVDSFYLMPNYGVNSDYIIGYTVYNVLNKSSKLIKFREGISKNSYINGVYNSKLYITDKNDLKQYEINPYKLEYRIVNENSKMFLHYNGSIVERNQVEYKNNNIYFEIDKSKIKKDIKIIKESEKAYYYVYNNELSLVYKNRLEQENKLIQLDIIDDIVVKGDNVYILSKDLLYRYNSNDGLKKILEYKEFKYNKFNMFDIYIKKNN